MYSWLSWLSVSGLTATFHLWKATKINCFCTAAVIDAAADADNIAAALEDAIFNEFRSTETKYKNRIRSRIANLKVHCSADHQASLIVSIFCTL